MAAANGLVFFPSNAVTCSDIYCCRIHQRAAVLVHCACDRDGKTKATESMAKEADSDTTLSPELIRAALTFKEEVASIQDSVVARPKAPGAKR